MAQFAITSAYLFGAARVIASDRFGYRPQMAGERGGVETLNDEEVSGLEAVKEMTGRSHSCIDNVCSRLCGFCAAQVRG